MADLGNVVQQALGVTAILSVTAEFIGVASMGYHSIFALADGAIFDKESYKSTKDALLYHAKLWYKVDIRDLFKDDLSKYDDILKPHLRE